MYKASYPPVGHHNAAGVCKCKNNVENDEIFADDGKLTRTP